MSQSCPQCNALISTEEASSERRLNTCPACHTLFQVDPEQPPAGPVWPELVLPKGVTVKSSADELHIVYRWFGTKHIIAGITGLFMGSVVFFIAADDIKTLFIFLVCPHSWFSVGFIYYALTGFFNSTTIRATPNHLHVSHGPLPLWGKKQLSPQTIEQLYIKEKKRKNKNSTTYTYQVRVQVKDGKDKLLVKELDTPLQALYLEQELEHYLGIEDRPVPGEFSRLPRQADQHAWQTLAQANGLNFTPGKLVEATYVTGLYHGYTLTLNLFRKPNRRDGTLHTRLVMAADVLKTPEKYPSPKDVVWIMDNLHQQLVKKQPLTIKGTGLKIEYKQTGIETKAKYLQFLFNSFQYLLGAYPYMRQLGGEAIEALHPIATNNNHPLQSLAATWIEEIATHTHRLQHQAPNLLCRLCVVHVVPREIELSWMNSVIYFGCPQCYQSRDFYTAEAVVAVLNTSMSTDAFEQGGILRVNWLIHKELFDFDMVEIIQATDEQVEHFAVRVGNDTNPARAGRYQKMHCLVWNKCRLSKNSMRILEHTFGAVKIKDTAAVSG